MNAVRLLHVYETLPDDRAKLHFLEMKLALCKQFRTPDPALQAALDTVGAHIARARDLTTACNQHVIGWLAAEESAVSQALAGTLVLHHSGFDAVAERNIRRLLRRDDI